MLDLGICCTAGAARAKKKMLEILAICIRGLSLKHFIAFLRPKFQKGFKTHSYFTGQMQALACAIFITLPLIGGNNTLVPACLLSNSQPTQD